MPASIELLKSLLSRCAEDRRTLSALIESHLEAHPGFAMSLDSVSAALEDLEELVEHTIALIPTDADSAPKIPPWDLPGVLPY
jgi:hypothetical protein